MIRIESYAIMWNADTNQGSVNLLLEGEGSRMLNVDSAAEGTLLLDILRNEDPVYIHDNHNQIITGIEPVGEGEGDSGSNEDE